MRHNKDLYSKPLAALGETLHFTAHSHHPWPDKTFEAHQQYWLDSTHLTDKKWDHIFRDIYPNAQKNIASTIGTKRWKDIFFASNTHDIIIKIFSALGLGLGKKIKILTTDGEFHSFSRLAKAWLDNELIEITKLDSTSIHFKEEFLSKSTSKNGEYDVVFISHVMFETGHIIDFLPELIENLPEKTHLIIDGYHSLGAINMDLPQLDSHPNTQRVFYMGGGYKYLQAGEGACFCLVPKDHQLKPYHTGWFASFQELETSASSTLHYESGGMAFMGATFDSSGLYRLNASFEVLQEQGGIENIVSSVKLRQSLFIELFNQNPGILKDFQLIGQEDNLKNYGSFVSLKSISLKLDNAQLISSKLKDLEISTDARKEYLRFGFGLYQSKEDILELFQRIR